MPDPLLHTKLHVPTLRSSSLVSRPRLTEQINQGLQQRHKLTLISAPAGFGKTTLISDFGLRIAEWGIPNSERSTPHLSWLSLDERDNDLSRFLAYLIAAVQTSGADIGEKAQSLLLSGQSVPAELVLTALLNEITAVPQPIVLVLDDYHLINAGAIDSANAIDKADAIDEALLFFLDNLPSNMHLVIATREDPGLPLHRLRARGQLTELRAADLRFTTAEAAQFLNEVMGLALAADDVAALEQRTEGWITGLQLAAISMRGSEDTARFIQSFTGSHRFVLDYLLEEVLHQQPAEIQKFLLQTAVLDRLSGPLCNALTLQENGQALLESLESANLFIVPLDNERRWYRYHHLFADLLRRLHQSDRDLIPTLHSRASIWYEENDLLPQAIDQAFAAVDFQRAASLVERAAAQMEAVFQSAVWVKWARALPEQAVRTRPVLCVRYATALIDCGELAEVEQRLDDAQQWLDFSGDRSAAGMIVEDEESLQMLPAEIALARANLASYQGDGTRTIKYADLALEQIPEDAFMLRAQAVVMRGLTYWALGDLQQAQKAIAGWIDSVLQAGNVTFAIASAFGLADMQEQQGQLRSAVRTYENALQLAAGQDAEMQQITAHHHLGLAMLHHEMGDDETAARYLGKSLELGEQSTLIDWPYRLHIAQARLRESEGDLEAALDLYDEAKRVYVTNPVPDIRPVAALKARMHIRRGRLAEAKVWAAERDLLAENQGEAQARQVPYVQVFEITTLARLLAAEERYEEALALLARLLQATQEKEWTAAMLEVLIVQALADQARGDSASALAALEQAMKTAAPEGYVRIFSDEGPPMAQLLSTAAAHGIMVDYANRLLAAFPTPAAAQPAPPAQSPIPIPHSPLVDPLSPRELEVLTLVAEGLTNREIASRLYLSLNTVKVHTRNIYSKLDVHHRAQAVARARELAILPTN